MRRVLSELRESEDVRTVLGDAVRPEPTWYLNGSPWVSGSVKMLQGNIDISFRVKGHKGTHKFAFLCTLTSLLIFVCLVWERRWHGLLHEYSQRTRRTFHNLCVSDFTYVSSILQSS